MDVFAGGLDDDPRLDLRMLAVVVVVISVLI
jgi:hypothetical protein